MPRQDDMRLKADNFIFAAFPCMQIFSILITKVCALVPLRKMHRGLAL
ncbi:MAG: hypothetical protein LBL30_00600 [Holosporales bacterium]|jgi:hypothetical protein|nr:hypothetical protein [Holosporales bacterium]